MWYGFNFLILQSARAFRNLLMKALLTELKSLYKVASFSLRSHRGDGRANSSWVPLCNGILLVSSPAEHYKVFLSAFNRMSFVIYKTGEKQGCAIPEMLSYQLG